MVYVRLIHSVSRTCNSLCFVIFHCVNVPTFIDPLYYCGYLLSVGCYGFSILHMWKHVCWACTSEWNCWLVMCANAEWRGDAYNQLMSWWEPAQCTPGSSFNRCHQTVFQSSFTQWHIWGASESSQRVKKKRQKRNVIVKVGCYWFSHVHEFDILPWAHLAYSCLKFPATNGM